MTEPRDNSKKAILLLGHGSKAKEANETLRKVARAVLLTGGYGHVEPAFLQLERPGISEAVEEMVSKGFKEITVMPYFLYTGLHVTKDIPDELEAVKAKYPDIEIRVTRNLDFHDKLIDITVERIEEIIRDEKTSIPLTQHPIEKASFSVIEGELGETRFTAAQLPVVKRVIHTTADFGFKDILRFSPFAIKAGINAIRKGRNIITDVKMVEAGIMRYRLKPFGVKVFCFSSDADVIRAAASENTTRTAASMRKAAPYMEGALAAIGNAPTALMELLNIIKNNGPRPALVIGVPVGFVGAAESKDALMRSDCEYIASMGRKGGSTVAAAIVNALAIEAAKGV